MGASDPLVADGSIRMKTPAKAKTIDKAARILLIIYGAVHLLGLIAVFLISVLSNVWADGVSSAYTIYQPFNLTFPQPLNASLVTDNFHSIVIAWFALLVPGVILLILGIGWWSFGYTSTLFGHVRARWLYSSAGISLCVWLSAVCFGTVQILEWVLLIGAVWGITTVDWIIWEVNNGSFLHIKMSKREAGSGQAVSFKLKAAVWLEVFLALFVLAQLVTAFALTASDVNVIELAAWVKAVFAIILITFVAYIVANCVFAMSNKLNDNVVQEITISTIVTVMVAAVSLTVIIGQYTDLNP